MAWTITRLPRGANGKGLVIAQELAVGNDKTLTLPTDLDAGPYHAIGLQIAYTSTGTAGTRKLSTSLALADGSVVFGPMHYNANADIPASQTDLLLWLHRTSNALFVAGVDGGPASFNLPNELIVAGGTALRVYDREDIDAADTLKATWHLYER